MLHVFINDNAASLFRQTGVAGEVAVLRDPLSEGPTPSGMMGHEWRTIRAQFLAGRCARKTAQQLYEGLLLQDQIVEKCVDHDEVIFWLDASFSDQAYFAYAIDEVLQLKLGDTVISRLSAGENPGFDKLARLGRMTVAQLAALFPQRRKLTRRELVLARQVWAAFRSPDPTVVERMARSDTSGLPGLGVALACRLEQFPMLKHGLTRLEEETLRQVALGINALPQLTREVRERQPYAYPGDVNVIGNIENTRLPGQGMVTQIGVIDQSVIQKHEQAPSAGTPGEETERRFVTFPGDVNFCRLLENLAAGRTPALVITGPGALPRDDDPPADLSAWSIELTKNGPEYLTGSADWIQRNGIDRWIGGVYMSNDGAPWRWDADKRRLVKKTE